MKKIKVELEISEPFDLLDARDVERFEKWVRIQLTGESWEDLGHFNLLEVSEYSEIKSLQIVEE